MNSKDVVVTDIYQDIADKVDSNDTVDEENDNEVVREDNSEDIVIEVSEKDNSASSMILIIVGILTIAGIGVADII